MYKYKFNGKELDEETGLYYYGARYYDPRTSIWLSVDPLAEKYPSWSSYSFCFDNPMKFIDYNGMEPIDPLKKMKIRDNRASNLQGKVRTKDGVPNSKPHQGFDLAATPGTPTFAVKNATVLKVINDEKAAYGNQVELKIVDDDGKITYAQYSHLSKIDVKIGQTVSEGQEIGKTGMSGNASNLPESQAHLHFELRSEPSPGLGLGGRLDPNQVLDTKFYSQKPSGNQSQTGVIKVDKDGTKTNMNIEK